MMNATVELIALWASSRPSLLAFCFSHLIIAVILLGGRGYASNIDGHGECVAGEAETLRADQFQSRETNSGGSEDEDSTVATEAGGRGSASSGANCHGAAEAGEAGAGAARLQASDTSEVGDGGSVSAAGTLQGRFGGEEDEDDDELMVRAEEFIQRMNRAWRTENVRVC